MAQDTFTEVSTQSWGSRLRGSFKGIIGGFILVGIAIWLLFWNEGRSVRRARALTEGAGVVVSVAAGAVDPAQEGKLVHLSGLAETFDVLRDEAFGVSENAIHLERKVEMYQWRENSDSTTETKVGGSTETKTTYSYEKAWSSSLNDSSRFKVPEGHENPARMPYERLKVSATKVTVGAFSLSSGLIGSISRTQPLALQSLDNLPTSIRYRSHLTGGGIFIGRDPAAPEVGDVRVEFAVVRPDTVSIVARQAGSRLEGYTTSNGGTIQLLTYGAVPAEQMFQAAQKANKLMTWALRVLGYFMIAWGLKKIFRPLSVLADVIPAIGRVMAASSGFVAYLLAAFLWLLVVAVAWLYHRPVLAVVMLLVAGGVAVAAGIGIAKAMKRDETPAAA